jgi:hypothetical protein
MLKQIFMTLFLMHSCFVNCGHLLEGAKVHCSLKGFLKQSCIFILAGPTP